MRRLSKKYNMPIFVFRNSFYNSGSSQWTSIVLSLKLLFEVENHIFCSSPLKLVMRHESAWNSSTLFIFIETYCWCYRLSIPHTKFLGPKVFWSFFFSDWEYLHTDMEISWGYNPRQTTKYILRYVLYAQIEGDFMQYF